MNIRLHIKARLRALPRPGPGLRRLMVVSGAMVLAALILLGVLGWVKGAAGDQQAARRWAGKQTELRYAQLSLFLADSAALDYGAVLDLRDELDAALKGGSLEARGPNARLWIDAFSVTRELPVHTGGSGQVTAAVTGIGGDFFHFHPLRLLYGQFITEGDLLKDTVVIDDVLAWQVFGAFNVVGFQLNVSGQACYVAGVVRRAEGWPQQAQYGTAGRLFAPFEVLEAIEPGIGATCYEMALPDPVGGYALGLIHEANPVRQGQYMLTENSARYGTLTLAGKLKDFSRLGTQTLAIALPWWENAARMAENWALLILGAVLMLLATPAVCVAILIHKAWRRRGRLLERIKAAYRAWLMKRWQARRRRDRQEEPQILQGEAEPENPQEEVLL